MAFENLFIRTKKSIGGIQLDAILTESHNSQITLTRNPVEFGAEITDHAIIEPKKVNILAVVSDTKLGLAAFGEIIDFITGLFGTSTTINITRSNAAYSALIQLQEFREPIEVQTKLVLYQDMIITNISTIQDKDTSKVVELNISLEEALIVKTKVTQLEPTNLEEGPPKEQGSPPDERGRQDPVEPSTTNEKTILKTVKDWLSVE